MYLLPREMYQTIASKADFKSVINLRNSHKNAKNYISHYIRDHKFIGFSDEVSLNAIPSHVKILTLAQLPSPLTSQHYKNCIPNGMAHNIP